MELVLCPERHGSLRQRWLRDYCWPRPRAGAISGEKAEPDAPLTAPPLAAPQRDSLNYLAAVLRGHMQPDGDLSSLETNVIVMQILDAALRSAQSGKTVTLTPLSQ